VFRKQGSGRSQTGFDRARLDDAEMGARRYPSSSIPVEMLPLRVGGTVVKRFYAVSLRSEWSPKASRDTQCQRANGNDDQHTLPPVPTNSSMSQRLHVAVRKRLCLVGLYTIGHNNTDITTVADLPSSSIPNPSIGYTMVPAPESIICQTFSTRILSRRIEHGQQFCAHRAWSNGRHSAIRKRTSSSNLSASQIGSTLCHNIAASFSERRNL
jgi:hypothetical protein